MSLFRTNEAYECNLDTILNCRLIDAEDGVFEPIAVTVENLKDLVKYTDENARNFLSLKKPDSNIASEDLVRYLEYQIFFFMAKLSFISLFETFKQQYQSLARRMEKGSFSNLEGVTLEKSLSAAGARVNIINLGKIIKSGPALIMEFNAVSVFPDSAEMLETLEQMCLDSLR